MTTIPVMLRLDPADWKKFQAAARDRDLMPAQLIRIVMRGWLRESKWWVEDKGKVKK